MVTDGVHHVADVAPQRQAEVGGWQRGGVGASVGLPLQTPQDAVGPCRLAFLFTGGGGRGDMGFREERVGRRATGTRCKLAGASNTRVYQSA